jgi:hypothetical protein
VKLCQGQVWKKDGRYVRIVRLERLEVEYKSSDSLAGKAGTKTVTSKKDFCRLLQGAHLLSARKNIPDGRVIPGVVTDQKKGGARFSPDPAMKSQKDQ